MSYVDPDFTDTYKDHSLVRLPGGCRDLDAFQLVPPEKGWMQSTVITFYGQRNRKQICVTGDLCPRLHGVLSNWGYGLGWFSMPKDEHYLCEKFLQQEWVPAKCLAWLKSELAGLLKEIASGESDEAEEADRKENLEAIIADWDSLSERGPADLGKIHDRLYDDLGQWAVDDGMPGMDYNPRDAGLLCAAQQAFVRLYPSLPALEETVVITKAAYRQLLNRQIFTNPSESQ